MSVKNWEGCGRTQTSCWWKQQAIDDEEGFGLSHRPGLLGLLLMTRVASGSCNRDEGLNSKQAPSYRYRDVVDVRILQAEHLRLLERGSSGRAARYTRSEAALADSARWRGTGPVPRRPTASGAAARASSDPARPRIIASSNARSCSFKPRTQDAWGLSGCWSARWRHRRRPAASGGEGVCRLFGGRVGRREARDLDCHCHRRGRAAF